MSDGADEGAELVECVDNEGYEFDLLLQKRYQVIPDAAGEEVGLVRIVDETGEDYLYPRGIFAPAERAESAPGPMPLSS
jgi:hypothetical protein